MTPNYLFIILCFIIIFAVFIMMVAVEVLEVKAQTIKAHCPLEGCVFLDWEYYSDYEYGSFKYWNIYCNDMKDTIFECV